MNNNIYQELSVLKFELRRTNARIAMHYNMSTKSWNRRIEFNLENFRQHHRVELENCYSKRRAIEAEIEILSRQLQNCGVHHNPK